MSCIMGAYTSAGKVKSVNQDAYCFMEAETSVGDVAMAVVCDGVGGLSNGELASTTVVQRFADWFETMLPKFLSFNVGEGEFAWPALQNVWEQVLHQVSADVLRYGEQEECGLGTTFTGMLVFSGEYLIGHVGDCRAYEFSNGEYRQLTRDHTLVMQQVESGLLTLEEAAHHKHRNVITQAVGSQEGLNPEYFTGKVEEDAIYLLCCDGFYNRQQLDELANDFATMDLFTNQGLSAICKEAALGCMERGEKDNITALAFCPHSSKTPDGEDDLSTFVKDPNLDRVHTDEGEEDDIPTFVSSGKKDVLEDDDDDEDDIPTKLAQGAK